MAANPSISSSSSSTSSLHRSFFTRSFSSPLFRTSLKLGFSSEAPRILTIRSGLGGSSLPSNGDGFRSNKSSNSGEHQIKASTSSSAIDFLTLCNRLKTTKRKGWINHGIKGPESIADHMYRMALMALIAGNLPGVNRERCIKIAIVHDIAEAIVGDITPADGVPKQEKRRREQAALNEMCEVLGGGLNLRAEEIQELWAEYENNSSIEANLVKDFDKTDTSMAIEAKFMKKWEFDSIEQASSSISSWFSGSYYECLLLQDYLDSIIGEVFYDAQEFLMNDQTMDRENVSSDDEHFDDQCSFGFAHDFNVYPASVEHTSSLHTPPPPTGSYKRRKIMKSGSFGSKFSAATEDVHHETVSSPKFLGSPRTHGSPKIYDSPRSYFSQSSFNSPRNYGTETFADLIRDSENSIEATQYSDVLILFRFNDRNLPFKLREIIMSDLRLLTLLEAGLPSWVIFVQSYPVFCHLYRPWMCPLVRALYVMISLVTVIIGFYDLYKNVPVLKATASRLCGPLFDWIETWEMVSRIKYLGTMLFLHNFEKAVMWFLLVTRAIRSFASVVAQPMLGPIAGIMGFLFPFWNICLEAVESFYSVVWVATGSSISLIIEVVQIILSPILFILSFIWSFTSLIICPMVWAIWGLLYAPIRVVIMLANLVAFVSSSTFDILGDIWLSLKGISNLASATEATVSTYEVSIWRSLWDDLFSQIFRAVRSIINGFIAFFVACNRHRLSIYNHILEFFRRLSLLGHRSQPQRSGHCRQMYGVQSRVNSMKKVHIN